MSWGRDDKRGQHAMAAATRDVHDVLNARSWDPRGWWDYEFGEPEYDDNDRWLSQLWGGDVLFVSDYKGNHEIMPIVGDDWMATTRMTEAITDDDLVATIAQVITSVDLHDHTSVLAFFNLLDIARDEQARRNAERAAAALHA